MGEGQINFAGVVDALADIGFDKWAQLETSCPTNNVEVDFKRNLQFVRDLVSKRNTKGSAAKA
jgi:sugar phosphate isomerase/epimerase